jgi:hypothetical protein
MVIPADSKAIMRCMVAEIVADQLDQLQLKYPKVGEPEEVEMREALNILKNEKNSP